MPNDDFALMRKSDYEVRLGEIKMNEPFIIRVKTLVNKVSIVLSIYGDQMQFLYLIKRYQNSN